MVLCTQAVQVEAARVYGGQLLMWDGPISRHDLDGYRAALIDLFILSRCDSIVTTQVTFLGFHPPIPGHNPGHFPQS